MGGQFKPPPACAACMEGLPRLFQAKEEPGPPVYEFTYFKMYKARGEPPRIALHASGVPWKDTSIVDYGKFKQDKAAGKYATGVPVLRTPDGKEFTQSIAIARFTAKLGSSNLYPADPEAAMAVDEIMDVCQDAMNEAKRKEYADGKLKAFVDILAKKLHESGGPFLTGEKLTIADIVAKYFVTEPLQNGEFPGIAKGYVDQWPALLKFDSAVENHDIVKAYQASKSS